MTQLEKHIHIQAAAKVRLYKVYVLPLLLYGSET